MSRPSDASGRANAGRRGRRGGFTAIEFFAALGAVFVLMMMVAPAMQKVRESARRVHCANNLCQIGLALQNYAMAFETLPPGTVNATGPIRNRPSADAYHVSWTVAILPHIELSTVYRRFDFRAGVYDRRNRPPQAANVATYHCPTGGGYAGCHAGSETPIDVANDGVLFLNSRVGLDEVPDGCGYTIAVGENHSPRMVWNWSSGTRDTLRNTGARPNAWNPPVAGDGGGVEDYTGNRGGDGWDAILAKADEIRPDDPALLAVGGFSSSHADGAQFSFCDGGVRFIGNDVDRDVFRSLGGRDDGAMPEDF